VAKLVTECVHHPDDNLLVAAILHDVVEDTEVEEQEVASRFGENVAFLVHQMSDDMSLPKQERKAKQVEKAPGLSNDAKILKIADKIANINDILTLSLDWDKERKINYIHWAKKVVDGCRGVNPKLERKFDELCTAGLKQLAP
jgi:(p)ppGpp synthase/HD superfamily hydrolase